MYRVIDSLFASHVPRKSVLSQLRILKHINEGTKHNDLDLQQYSSARRVSGRSGFSGGCVHEDQARSFCLSFYQPFYGRAPC